MHAYQVRPRITRIARIRQYIVQMRYRLRTLHLLLGIAPPLLAVAYWAARFCYSYPHVPVVLAFLVVNVAAWLFGPIALYRGLIRAVCGPDSAISVRCSAAIKSASVISGMLGQAQATHRHDAQSLS